MKSKKSRLDESLSLNTLIKSFTGQTNTSIDPEKIIITSTGNVTSTTFNSSSEIIKKNKGKKNK